MEMNIGSRLKHAWNAFLNRDPPGSRYYGGGYSYRPDRMRFSRGSERTIINAIYIHDQAGATSWRDWCTYCNNWRTCRCIFAAR